MQTGDAELKRTVLAELRQQTSPDIAGICVDVTAGIVTLAGTVSSWRSRAVADAVARQVPGVLRIHNDILFSGMVGTDHGIRRSVRDALDRALPAPDASRIDGAVSMGWVTLTGQLDCWARRMQAETVIASLAGVCGIFNCIGIREVSVCNQKESET